MSRYLSRKPPSKALAAMATTVLALWLAGGAAQAAQTLKLLMPWNQTSAGNVAVGNHLIKMIEETTGGAVKIHKFDNSVVPPFQQLEPVASGVFDLHYTNPAYHAGDTMIGQIMDTVVADAAKRHDSGVWDMVDKAYQKRNLKLIAAGPSTGFQFLVRGDIAADGTLKGMKIRSNPAYDGTIRALGGSPIQLPIGEVYTAMQNGLIDGTAFPVHGVVSAKMGEVAKFQVRPVFGQGTAMVLMNLGKWKALSPDLQAKMLAAGRKFEETCYKVVAVIANADEAALVKSGSPTKRLNADAAAHINQYYNESLWAQAIKTGGTEAADIVEFVKSHDLVFNGF
ncbi:MAG TPA: TRAP transporter substrate-binding protein DctP [Hyphomicrobiaceae bacterium]|nr:TRAP transporter substrate-binding protein DctP [Hyphomicrobiaceae bacterium]